jgi:hypothetical protein
MAKVEQVSEGLIVGLEGSWIAGVDGGRPGIIMKAHPLVGDFYRQEFLLGTAEDLAEIVRLDETVTVHGRRFDHCLKSKETSPLEPDAVENKLYAPGIGNVLVIDSTGGEQIELIRIKRQ